VKTIVAAVEFPIVNEKDLEESEAGFRFMYFFLRVLEPSRVGRFFIVFSSVGVFDFFPLAMASRLG